MIPMESKKEPLPAKREGLSKSVGTKWVGTGELWLDRLQNEARRYECTLAVDAGSLRYTWSDEGKPQEGTIALRDRGAVWTDTWHQPKSVECSETAGSWGLLALQYTYSAGGSDWGWRILLAQRPSGELLLQMTNVAPWGEEMRAVRMVFTRKT